MMFKKNNTVLYVVGTYVLFFLLFLLTGLVLMITGNVPQIMVAICSWAPTMVLLMLFKRLVPDTRRIDFFKNLFAERINLKLVGKITVIQILIFAVAVWCISAQKGLSILSLTDFSLAAIGLGLFNSLITGATGEESGWRGFLQPIFVKKSGVIKGSLIVGLIWGFWHAPLWFLTSGYSGVDLLVYVTAFLISIISISVVIGVCYDYNRNLVVPMWIHFLFNFTASLFVGDVLNLIVGLGVFYAIAAAGFVMWYRTAPRVLLNRI